MACEVNGIYLDENLVIYGDAFSEDTGYKLAEELLSKTTDFQAIFTTDDLLAIGALKKLKEASMTHIIVTGFNNIPLAPYQDPPLASIDINAQELGYRATKLLIDSLEGVKKPHKHYIINCDFIERESFNPKH